MVWVQAILMFLFSIGNDWLSVQWHRSRENGWPLWGAMVAVALGLISWLSIWWVVTDSPYLMLADLAGTAIGTYWSFLAYHKGQEGEFATPASDCIRPKMPEAIAVTPASISFKIVRFFKDRLY